MRISCNKIKQFQQDFLNNYCKIKLDLINKYETHLLNWFKNINSNSCSLNEKWVAECCKIILFSEAMLPTYKKEVSETILLTRLFEIEQVLK